MFFVKLDIVLLEMTTVHPADIPKVGEPCQERTRHGR